MNYWAVCHERDGWLVDTGVGGTYSTNVDGAQWFRSVLEAVETLIACDLLEPEYTELTFKRWSRVGSFLIVQVV